MKNFLTRRSNVKNYAFILLIAIEFLMSFTFLGYIHIPPISITFAYIPIIVAGCFLGTGQATFIGFLFGLASMYKATAYYVMPSDMIFSPFMSDFPLGSVLLSVGVRTLFGLLIGVAYALIKKCNYKRFWIGLIAFLSPTVHAAMVYGEMGILFPEYMPATDGTFVLETSNILATVLCVAVVEVLWGISKLKVVQNFCRYVNHPVENFYGKKRLYIAWGVFIAFTLVAAVASSYYFASRISYMLNAHGITLSADVNHDLLHLQVQFLIAAFSLNFIMAIALMIIYKYLSYKEYLGEMDSLTKVMGRGIFFEKCKSIASSQSDDKKCFVFVDVDYLKTINDTYGHPAGDKVLREIAQKLKDNFKDCGYVGRLGGDEFAIIIDKAPAKDVLTKRFEKFEQEISGIVADGYNVSCSIGAYYFDTPQDFQTVYADADKVLYEAKEKGRACCVIK